MGLPRYWLDSNVFIEAKNGPYAFDLVPGFWEWLARAAADETIASPIAVYQELIAGQDELESWARRLRRRGHLFCYPSAPVQAQFSLIANHVATTFRPEYASDFLAGADPWLVAHASRDGSTVITHERLVGANSVRPKIPNVCVPFSVSYLSVYDMLRREQVSFR